MWQAHWWVSSVKNQLWKTVEALSWFGILICGVGESLSKIYGIMNTEKNVFTVFLQEFV